MPPQDLTLTAPAATSLVAVEPAAPDLLCADLPADLDELGRLSRWHEGRALLHAYESGRALRRAKSLLPHGAFGPWLEENFPLSDEIARQRLQLVEWVGGRQQLLSLLGDMPVRKVRLLMQAPESDVDDLATNGMIGGLPLERIKATPYAQLQAEIDKLRRRAESAEEIANAAATELEAAQSALAERQIGARRRDAAIRWNAKIDKVKVALDEVITTSLEPLLDEIAGQYDLLPAASQAHAGGLLEYLQARMQLEVRAFAQRLGARPGADPTDRVPAALIVDIVASDRASKADYPLPERRIPATAVAAMEREGLSLARLNPRNETKGPKS